jgi:frataxin-like iron-binding protein CyaY
VKDTWFYSRDGELMSDLLTKELSEAFGESLDLGLANVSEKVE